jgi:hypothetical protein
MDLWDQGKYKFLVEQTVRDQESFYRRNRGSMTAEAIIDKFNKLALQGELHRASRLLAMCTAPGGILDPAELDEKTGATVAEVLQDLHPPPDPLHADTSFYPDYSNKQLPPLAPLQISSTSVEAVAAKMHGAAGLGGVDAPTLKSWLLRHKKASAALRESLAAFTSWVASQLVPWAAIRALMSNRLIALDKLPGVRPIGIGHVWRRIMAKLVLQHTALTATLAAGVDQLCTGMPCGTEAAIHSATTIWREHANEPDYGFIQLDASNAFNTINRAAMLYVIRYEWPEAAMFVFNTYKHHGRLTIRSIQGGDPIHLYSQTGITQGCPLSMFCYGLGLLPLIRNSKCQFPQLFHAWLADDGTAAGKLSDLQAYFLFFQREGPKHGYCVNPTKCVIISKEINHPKAHELFHNLDFDNSNYKAGHRYLGGFVGERCLQEEYVEAKVLHWTHATQQFANAAAHYPQTAYAVYTKCLQMEWTYIQRTVDSDPLEFTGLETAIKMDLITALFGDGCHPPRRLTSLPRKAAGLGISDPTKTQHPHFTTSSVATNHIMTCLTESHTEFSFKTHMNEVETARSLHQSEAANTARAALAAYVAEAPTERQRMTEHAASSGHWLSVTPSLDSHTTLSPTEFRDGLHLRYAKPPLDLPRFCDGCNVRFTLDHGLSCKKGGLILHRHNALRDEMATLMAAALSPSCVRSEPLISPSDAHLLPDTPPTAAPAPSNNNRGDLLVRGFIERNTDTIIDFQVTNLNAASYRHKTANQAFVELERAKNRKHKRACQLQRRQFAPFIASCDGNFGPHAKQLMQRLANLLAKKWNRPYSAVANYVYSRISISLLRSTSLCLRGSRFPAALISAAYFSFDEAEGIYTLHQH